MRVVFAVYAEKTHFFGMVPLAWALQTAGHEVRVASQPELTAAITGAGLTAVPVGTDHRFREVMRRTGQLAQDDPLPFDFALPAGIVTWEYLRDGYRRFVPWWCRLVNDSMVDDLVTFCRQWRPDLVLWEPVTYAGPIAATAAGAVHARVMWSVDLFARMRAHFLRLRAEQPVGEREDPLAHWLTGHVARYGGTFSEVMTHGHFTVDSVPESLRSEPGLGLDLDLCYAPMRHVPYHGASVVPPWLREPPARPRVCLTLGTSGSSAAERQYGYVKTVRDVLNALAGVDVEVVATLPEPQQAELGRVPDNARLVEFAPLNVLAPTCAAVIHHGGNGTYCTALLHGVPQLILPSLFDLPLRAGFLANQGAGLTIAPADVTGRKVRDRLLRLLKEPSFRRGAARLRDEMLALPTPGDLVPQIEKLTATYRADA